MSREYRINHAKAWNYFVVSGLIPINASKHTYCLHHKNPYLKSTNVERYNEWNIEDLIPMTISDHMALHAKIKKENGIPINSLETREKISKTKKGHIVSDETRHKISESLKGRKNPKHSQKLKIFYETHNVWNKGKNLSEETRQKISNSKRGKKQSLETRKKRYKAVIQYDVHMNEVSRYESLTDAATKNKFNKGGLAYACRNFKKAYGFFWAYI